MPYLIYKKKMRFFIMKDLKHLNNIKMKIGTCCWKKVWLTHLFADF